jgi:hypothetical protein
MDYREQIKSPKWQKRRLEILQRDDFTCQICGNKDKTLHVHHTTYIPGRSIWEYPDEMLVTLCEDCHEIEHKFGMAIPDLIKQLNEDGITATELSCMIMKIHDNITDDPYLIRSIIGNRGINGCFDNLSKRREVIMNGRTTDKTGD